MHVNILYQIFYINFLQQKALRLLVDNRVNFALHADYRENHELDQVVKTILDRIATERDLDILKAREEKKKQLLK